MKKELFLIGNPINHSFSPTIHNTISECKNLPYEYKLMCLEKDEIGNFVKKVKNENIRGFNVTVPYKQEIIKYLDVIDEASQKIGAVNTVVNHNGILKGCNTDAPGFLRALVKDGIQVKGKKVILFGAGGAARGLVWALKSGGAKSIHIFNRSTDKAKAIAEEYLEGVFYHGLSELENGFSADIAINSTTLGMHPNVDTCVLKSFESIKGCTAACDIVYNPGETKFLKLAKEKGLKTQNGLLMLIYQGVLANKIWTGAEPDDSIIAKIEERLKKPQKGGE